MRSNQTIPIQPTDYFEAISRAEGYLQYIGAYRDTNGWSFDSTLHINQNSPLVYEGKIIVNLDFVKDLHITGIKINDNALPNNCVYFSMEECLNEEIYSLPLSHYYNISFCENLKYLNYSFPDCISLHIQNVDLDHCLNLNHSHIEDINIQGNFMVKNFTCGKAIIDTMNRNYIDPIGHYNTVLNLNNVKEFENHYKDVSIENYTIYSDLMYDLKDIESFKYNSNADTDVLKLIGHTCSNMRIENCELDISDFQHIGSLHYKGVNDIIGIENCNISSLYTIGGTFMDIYKLRHIDDVDISNNPFGAEFLNSNDYSNDEDQFYRKYLQFLFDKGLEFTDIMNTYYLTGTAVNELNNVETSSKGIEKFDF